jgi:hypothetical protein
MNRAADLAEVRSCRTPTGAGFKLELAPISRALSDRYDSCVRFSSGKPCLSRRMERVARAEGACGKVSP